MSELKKGYFPHYFKKECNEDYVGNIPSKKHYGYNQMKQDERTKFLKWYEERVRENYVFDFKKEILEYCRSDVDILRRGIMKLREDFRVGKHRPTPLHHNRFRFYDDLS